METERQAANKLIQSLKNQQQQQCSNEISSLVQPFSAPNVENKLTVKNTIQSSDENLKNLNNPLNKLMMMEMALADDNKLKQKD